MIIRLKLIWRKIKWMWQCGYDGWRALEEVEESYANVLTILAHGKGHQITLFEKGEYLPRAFYRGTSRDFDAAVMKALVNVILDRGD